MNFCWIYYYKVFFLYHWSIKVLRIVQFCSQYLKSRPSAVEKEKNKIPTPSRTDEVTDRHQPEELLEFDDEDEGDVGSVDDLETCEKCGRRVSPFEMPEHLDFHVAQELQVCNVHNYLSLFVLYNTNIFVFLINWANFSTFCPDFRRKWSTNLYPSGLCSWTTSTKAAKSDPNGNRKMRVMIHNNNCNCNTRPKSRRT